MLEVGEEHGPLLQGLCHRGQVCRRVALAGARADDGEESDQEVQPPGAVTYRKNGATPGCSLYKVGLSFFLSSKHTVVLTFAFVFPFVFVFSLALYKLSP